MKSDLAPSGSLRESLRSSRVSIGSWITLAHPGIAEIMAGAGFDWLVVDLEHSVITIREAEELIRVIGLSGVVPLVRVSSNDPVQIKRVMDAGAHGVIVPMVNSRGDAENAVAAVYYPTRGRRGVGLARAQRYGMTFAAYKDWLEQEAVVIVQIEHQDGVNHLQEILSTDGVDGFIVGPYDLSGSLGLPGQLDHPRMMEASNEIRRVSKGYKAAPGYHVVSSDPALVNQKIQEGYRFVAYGVDILFLGEAARSGLERLRKCSEG